MSLHQSFAVGALPYRPLLAVLASVMLAACYASGALFSGYQARTDGTTEIVIYRLDVLQASGAPLNVYVDEQYVGTLKNAGWLSVRVRPGERALRTREKIIDPFRPTDVRLVVTARPGEPVAVRVFPGALTGSFPTAAGRMPVFGPWTMEQVPADFAADELKYLRQSQ